MKKIAYTKDRSPVNTRTKKVDPQEPTYVWKGHDGLDKEYGYIKGSHYIKPYFRKDKQEAHRYIDNRDIEKSYNEGPRFKDRKPLVYNLDIERSSPRRNRKDELREIRQRRRIHNVDQYTQE